MPTEKKVQQVEMLKEKLSQCVIAIATDYRGLSVNAMTDLRRRLREKGIEYKVVKNTLIYRAAEEADRPEIVEVVKETTGIAFGYGDPVEAAKAIDDFIRTSRLPLSIRGAVLDRQVLSGDNVSALAKLPPKEVLVAQVLGQMKAPITGLVLALSGTMRGLVTVLQRHIEQAETAGAGLASTAEGGRP